MNPIRVLLLGRKRVTADTLRVLVRDPRFELIGVVTDSHLADSPTVAAASALGVAVLDHQRVAEEAERHILVPDFVVSVLYWRKLKGAMLFSDCRFGVLNFHPAPLPDYKGCGGYNFAILDGLSQWATTAHYVDDGIDTGPIIEVRRFPICPATSTARSLERASMNLMSEQIVELLDRVATTRSRLTAYKNEGGRYISRQEMNDAKQIVPGDDVERKARAFFFPPYEGAWTMVQGVRCTVLPARLMAELAEPGTTHLFTDAQSPVDRSHGEH
jgi:methionyl-tRNA formyltransferase